MILYPDSRFPSASDYDRYWFGIDFGNSFIKVSGDSGNFSCTSVSGEKMICLDAHISTTIVCRMESKITRFELFNDVIGQDEYFDFTIINIKRLLDCLGSTSEQDLNEIKILENDEIDGEKRLITEILTQNVNLNSRGDIENMNKMMVIKIMDTKTNYSIMIPLFIILVKLFEKLRVEIYGKDLGREMFKRNVITLPVFYNDLQSTFLRDAFSLAGFRVERSIYDVSSAALAYSIDKKTDRYFMVLNCGSSRAIAALYKLEDSCFELLEYSSDNSISGNCVDQQLVNYCIQEFKKKTKKQLVNEKARDRLLEACKMAKEELYGETNPHNVLVRVDSLMDGMDFSLVLSKPKFEQLATSVISKVTSLLTSLLERNSISIHFITDFILCGGCCQISKFSSIIREIFKGNNQFIVHDSVPPKSIKARGASVFCDKFRIRQFNWAYVVLPLSIGIENNGRMMILAQRNVSLPYKKLYTLTKKVNPATNQYHFNIFMGERAIPRNNLLLGEFCVPNMDNSITKEFTLEVNISYEYILSLVITDATSIKEHYFQADWKTITAEYVSENVRLGELDNSS